MNNPEDTLSEFELQSDWSKRNNISPRTTARYRMDGLPWMEFGGRIFIHRPGAKDWIAKRVKGGRR